MLDQISLLTAIGFSAAALMITLFLNWLNARADGYLLSWSGGMGFIVPGVVLYVMSGRDYSDLIQFSACAFMLTGFPLVYAGASQFRLGRLDIRAGLIAWLVPLIVCALAFIFGYSGIGTAFFNAAVAVLLTLSGIEYWRGRVENPLPMIANTILYLITALSFALCAIVLIAEGDFVLTATPRNWAEDISSIMIIVGLTGIGALSLTLNQARAARHHRNEALTDPLTGLDNRRALFEKFSGRTIEPGMAVIMFDLDHFKAINDGLGHAIGDRVLIHFAEILQDTLRATDTAARLGGEEFCVVLDNLVPRTPAQIAEHIRAGFAEAATPDTDPPLFATVSAGLAVSAGDGEDFEALLRRADEALYMAKSEGRNRVHLANLRLVA